MNRSLAADRPQGSSALRASAVLLTLLLSACGGGGGGGGGNPPPAGNVTISGVVTYQRVPFRAGAMTGLDMNAPIASPVRGAVVECIDSGGTTVRGTATTDASGNYSMQVGSGRNVFIRVKAQLLRASAGQGTPAWNFRVLNNTNGNALYVLDSAPFTTGTTAITQNLNAATGWGGTSYTGTRAAAPFSLLDVAYQVLTLVQSASANAAFPDLNIFWSTQNRPSTTFNPATGEIVTTSFQSGAGGGVFVLGLANTDTDEFDQHVIAHELGHYFQDAFSRDDSIGGSHSGGDRLDLRVAFSEGWGNAFSAMVRNDPLYRDSFGASQGSDFSIDIESNAVAPAGWFNEASVQSVIYDVFDAAADGNDALALGFAPIFQVMNSDLPTIEPLSAVFPFVRALKTRNPGSAAAIDALVNAQAMVGTTMDDLGSTETNNGGDPMNLPVYSAIATNGTPVQVCSTTPGGQEYNKLGNRKFLRFSVVVRQTFQIRVQGPASSDPDVVLHRQGFVAVSDASTRGLEDFSRALDPGNYVLEVYDFFATDEEPHPDNPPPAPGPVCMNVTVVNVI